MTDAALLDEWDVPTRELPAARDLLMAGDLHQSRAVARAFELLAELQARGQLIGVSVEGDAETGYRFAFKVPPEEVDYLRREWPAELHCPALDPDPQEDVDTDVHALPEAKPPTK